MIPGLLLVYAQLFRPSLRQNLGRFRILKRLDCQGFLNTVDYTDRFVLVRVLSVFHLRGDRLHVLRYRRLVAEFLLGPLCILYSLVQN